MQLNIKPQDRAHPEKLELELHPALIQRLRDYAKSLADSDLSYVAAQVFDQVLPAVKGATKRPGHPGSKSKKEPAKKAA
jgi:hypothetical protein